MAKLSSRTLWILTLAVGVAIFLPYFRNSVVPVADTGQILNSFHAFFSALKFEQELVLWNPYNSYGLPGTGITMYTSAIDYLVGTVFALFGGTNTLLAFKVSVLLQYLLFLTGTFLFCFRFIRSQWGGLVVIIGTLFSFNWTLSLDANFHVYYLFPFIFIHWHDYFVRRRVRDLLLGGVWCVASFPGNTPYFSPLMFFIAIVFLVTLAIQERKIPLKGAVRFENFVLLFFLIAFAIAFVGLLGLNYNDLTSIAPGRDPKTGAVPYNVFRTYAGVIRIGNIFDFILTGAHRLGDVTFYIGLLPWPFALYAVFTSKHRLKAPLAMVAIALFCFSMGGITTKIVYHSPGMKFYRHISLVWGQIKYIVLLLAGMGVDQWVSRTVHPFQPGLLWRRQSFVVKAIIGFVALEMVMPYLLQAPPFGANTLGCPTTRFTCWIPFVVRSFGYLLVIALFRRSAHLIPALVFVFAMDIGWFQLMVHRESKHLTKPETIATIQRLYTARPALFVDSREFPHLLAKNENLVALAALPNQLSLYVTTYSLTRIDPCFAWFRTDFLPKGVAALFEKNHSDYHFYQDHLDYQSYDERLLKQIGCYSPKLFVARELTEDLPKVAHFDIEVNSFGWNHIDLRVRTLEPGYLYYAEASHPGWSASVNGVSVPIESALGAFKAVKIGAGESFVSMRFFNGLGSKCHYLLVGLSLIWISCTLLYLTRLFIRIS